MIVQEQLQHNILYSCVTEQKRGHEQFVAEHSLSVLLSGEAHFYTNEGIRIFGTGTIGLMRRNQLARSLKMPAADGRPFKSISILLDQESLRTYSNEHEIRATGPYTGEPMQLLTNDVYLKGFFDSLLPYFEQPEQLSKDLTALKTKEAIGLLLHHDARLKDLLFDFSEPHKIDLEAYMNKHYTYNVPLAQFARLTGRSLATFKRDFQKTFEAPPERWIKEKRLEHAHFLISKKKQSPADIYLDVGFENLSHFSTSFKKLFGYTPSSLK